MTKLTTYHIEEKTFCDIHNCEMVQVPCSMYVYCPKCEDAKKNETSSIKNISSTNRKTE
jgi:hypothetical protein